MADNSQPLSRDAIFDLLSNSRRRFVLRRLQNEPSGTELGDMATKLAAEENGLPPEELSAQQRKRTYVSLYQTHVPKLVEAGVVTYDSDSGIIRATDRIDELAGYFQGESDTVPWEAAYLSLGLIGIGAFIISHLIQVPVAAPSYVAFVVLFVFILLSIFQYLYVETYGMNGSEILVRGE